MWTGKRREIDESLTKEEGQFEGGEWSGGEETKRRGGVDGKRIKRRCTFCSGERSSLGGYFRHTIPGCCCFFLCSHSVFPPTLLMGGVVVWEEREKSLQRLGDANRVEVFCLLACPVIRGAARQGDKV